jgi:CRP-like cAMP-binding protein
MWREKDTIKTYQDGEVIVKEGSSGTEMYIISTGAVRVTKLMNDKEVELARLDRGDFFGEMSLLENVPRSATVTAVGTTKVLVLNIGNFMLKIRRDPSFAFTLMQKMSKRIRSLNDNLLGALKSASGEDVQGEITKSEFRKYRPE